MSRWRTRYGVLALAGGLLLVAGWAVAYFLTRPSPPPPVGTGVGFTAPDFSLEDLHGRRFALSDFRGRVVLLLFWQSTCPDCNLALPKLRELWHRYRDRGVILVGVNLDYDAGAAEQYIAAHGYGDQITLRTSYDAAMDVVRLLSVPFVPYCLVLDKRGVIRFAGVFPNLPTDRDLEPWL